MFVFNWRALSILTASISFWALVTVETFVDRPTGYWDIYTRTLYIHTIYIHYILYTMRTINRNRRCRRNLI